MLIKTIEYFDVVDGRAYNHVIFDTFEEASGISFTKCGCI